MPTIRLEKATKTYRVERKRNVDAVSQIDLTIHQGEFVFVVGSSGAGKSTLLRLIAGQTRADSGRVLYERMDLGRLPLLYTSAVRRKIGYVSQEPQFMRRRTILENLKLVAKAEGLGREKHLRLLAAKALSIVGLPEAGSKYPGELSIGQCRRVELARAIINSPSILVLDEITANLDEDNIWDMLHILDEMNRQGTTVVMATHASMFVNIMRKRVVTLVDGRVAGDVAGGRYGQLQAVKKGPVLPPSGPRWVYNGAKKR